MIKNDNFLIHISIILALTASLFGLFSMHKSNQIEKERAISAAKEEVAYLQSQDCKASGAIFMGGKTKFYYDCKDGLTATSPYNIRKPAYPYR